MKQSNQWHSGLLPLVITCCVQVLGQAPVPKQTVIEVPFELIRGEIVVPVTVNGAGPFWMLLDTGVDPSVVELGTAKSIGLKIAANGHQGDGGGTSRNLAYETSLPIVQLGGLTATKIDALAMDLSKISATRSVSRPRAAQSKSAAPFLTLRRRRSQSATLGRESLRTNIARYLNHSSAFRLEGTAREQGSVLPSQSRL
jgi:Aspartyl protease